MTQYATTTDLANLGLPPSALTNVSTAIQTDHLEMASALINSYLRSQYTLPLVSPYPDEIIAACVHLASYTLLVRRGFRPDQYDENYRQKHEDTIRWLEQLSRGEVHLCAMVDSTPAVAGGAPQVVSMGSPTLYSDIEEGTTRAW